MQSSQRSLRFWLIQVPQPERGWKPMGCPGSSPEGTKPPARNFWRSSHVATRLLEVVPLKKANPKKGLRKMEVKRNKAQTDWWFEAVWNILITVIIIIQWRNLRCWSFVALQHFQGDKINDKSSGHLYHPLNNRTWMHFESLTIL